MRRVARTLLIPVVAAAIGLAPDAGWAVGYEDSLDDCNYPHTFDLMVMRPLGLTALAIGTILYVPLAPMSLATTPQDFGQVTENLVYSPARFTFRRRLGECTGVTLSY